MKMTVKMEKVYNKPLLLTGGTLYASRRQHCGIPKRENKVKKEIIDKTNNINCKIKF
jgi:hypothetical protein